jgi:multidrug efflux pump subunit AcrA (membrane-fusion protein)
MITATRKHKQRIGIGIGMAALAIAVALFLWNQSYKGDKARKASTVKVVRGNMDIKLVVNGTVTSHSCVAIRPPIPGRIESILVAEGDHVLRGRVVGTISSAERVTLLDAAATRGQAELRKWKDMIKPAPLVAPVSGVVISRNADPGSTVSAETELLTISDRLIVRVQLHEDDIAKIYTGQRVQVTVDAMPDMLVKGTVERIAYNAKLINNVHTYETDLAVPDLPANVRSGMGVNITFTLAHRTNVLLLPSSAIRESNGVSTVKLADDDTVTHLTIKTGLRDGQMVEIVSGLTEAQAVIDESGNGSHTDSKNKSPIMNSYNKN